MRFILSFLGLVTIGAFYLKQEKIAVNPNSYPSYSVNNENKAVKKPKKLFPSEFGNPYLSNYNFEQSDIQVWSISQDLNGEMIFAHRQGIIVFDGKMEEHIRIPSIPIVLKPIENKEITLVGCDDEYGYLVKNRQGIYEYHELSGKSLITSEITDIKITSNYIYFFSEKALYRHNKATLAFDKSWYTSGRDIQNGILQIGDDIYLSIKNKGVYKFNENGKKSILPRSYNISQQQIAFSVPVDKKNLVIGTFENNLYLFDGIRISDFNSMAGNYISENQLTGGIDLNKNLFAVSTITGGCLILNKKSGELVNLIDIKSGLPDNEIYALGNDYQGGLWLSHGFGITRVNYNLPVKDFNKYEGIEGNILEVVVVNNKTYIATNQGVYYQDSVVRLKETIKVKPKVQVNKKVNDNKNPNPDKTLETNKETKEESKEIKELPKVTNEKKSLLQRWRARREEKKKQKESHAQTEIITDEQKTTQEKELEKPESNETIIIDTQSDKDIKTIEKKDKQADKKAESKVWSVDYIFKKVKNINGKCRQLIKYGDLILVASNNGLYEIKGKDSKIILKKNYINYVLPSKINGVFYIGTDKGITLIKRENNKWVEYPKIQPLGFNSPVYTIAEDENLNLWVGNDNEVLYFIVGKNFKTISFEVYDFGKEYPEKFSIRQIDNSIYLLSSGQIFRYNTSTNKIEPNNLLVVNKLPYLKYLVSQNNTTWLQNEKEWVCKSSIFKPQKYQLALLNLFQNIQNIYVDDNKNLWVIDGKNNLYKILHLNESNIGQDEFKVFLKRITDDFGKNEALDNIKIPSEISSLTFTIGAPYFLNPYGTTYQYTIKDLMNGWSDWNPNHEFPFIVKPGYHIIQVRAKNVLGQISTSKEYVINVKSPFWMEPWFIVIVTAAVVMVIALIIILLQKKREKKLQRDNKILEAKVEERTIEIVKQKEQIELKNREITDSLNYASQIQSAVLPPLEIFREKLDDYFVLNLPKDIVSGDFYWAKKIDNKLIVTAADCTGHGVPGAFLSLLGLTFLNEITANILGLKANIILELLRKRVIESLNQGGYNRKRLDGIDLSLIIVDFENMVVQFAGANNSIYLLRNGFLSEFKGNRMPIGLHAHLEVPFTNHDIEIKKGDLIYLFSDGFVDQFGGDYGRKFLSRNFKTLLAEIYQLPMEEQKNVLNDVLESWKTNYEQIDDVLVLGLKI
ncbi:MAG: SpoIIE family protein phosphatase [Bacteroidales bacterium]